VKELVGVGVRPEGKKFASQVVGANREEVRVQGKVKF
jgi:hypothetical protein